MSGEEIVENKRWMMIDSLSYLLHVWQFVQANTIYVCVCEIFENINIT